jgi:hypothetical protein
LSSSLCSFLHSLVTSFLLGPNILLNTLYFILSKEKFTVQLRYNLQFSYVTIFWMSCERIWLPVLLICVLFKICKGKGHPATGRSGPRCSG